MTIDTSKLSRALRVGGTGIRAVPCGELGVDLFLPDGACPWTGQKIANVEKLEPRYIQLLAGIGYYQDWLQRAKCEHVLLGYIDCRLCGALEKDINAGHYTLLPEPADVCIVPGCRKVSLCPGHALCLDCDGKWSDAPFVKPIDNNHWTYDDDRRAWAAKQSEAPTSVTVPDGDYVLDGGDPTTLAELEALCRACERDRWCPWKGMMVRAKRTATGYEVRVVDHGNPDTENFHCSAIGVHLPTSKDDLKFWIFRQMQALFNARDKQSEGGDATSAVPQQSGAPIAGPGDEPGSFNPSDLTGLSVVVCAECKAPFDPRNSWDARVCAYCYKRVNSVEQARADLDRPLPERIELARQELGYDDGFGVYSLPGEGK